MLQVGAWIILGMIAAADDPSPADLVRRLGSDRFADRVEAARALERLGSRAIPELRAAEHSDDARVRARVPGLIEAIERGTERARFEHSTELQLDFRDRPLSEVIETLNDRYHLGLAIQFGPGLPPGVVMRRMGGIQGVRPNPKQAEAEARKVTIVSEHPLPFWKAIDRICEAGQLRHDLHPTSGFGTSTGRFVLYGGVPGGHPVASDSGPIRVKVTGLHATLERNLSVASSPPRGHLTIRMAVIPEPGLLVRPVGPVTIAEAIDDRGRKLTAGLQIAPNHAHQIPTLNGLAGFEAAAALLLNDLDLASRSLRRLRGTIPVVMVARTPSPLVFPLDRKAAGRSGRIDGATVRVVEVVMGGDDEVSAVVIEIATDRPQANQFRPRNARQPPDLTSFRPDQILNGLEMLDARGRPVAMSWNWGQARGPGPSSMQYRLIPNNFVPLGQAAPHGPPTLLRFHGLVQKQAEIAFDFHDVPMP